ncbi:unnamed protein product [Cyprideis torosa]|uniref:Uncharacterized protein n=1 Tax=Cyprideis torosa TaxID=163714 RepID=A0A7R8W8U6_9CRUS|nr:unnamed protein product [Cyprideis torosa]CAG0889018.1 unnamed protein product [Cyprideis torosa]
MKKKVGGYRAQQRNHARGGQVVVTILESLPKQSLLGSELSSLLQGHLFSHLSSVHDRLAQREPVPLMTPEEELLDRASHYTDDSVKIVRIDKTSEPLGATVRNEGDAVVIARVVRGGAAERSGLLHEGDEILEVNGVEMRGRSVNEVCDILAGMQGTLTFLVIPCAVVREERNYHRQNAPPVVHMRALFDYDPEEDLYIPCRELGISFSKGDILHIRSQEDPNWWQAFREGEEDHALAGLIPSKSFQEQREALKQSLVGEERSLGEKGHLKSSTLLCAKKSSKKKKRKMYNPSQSEDEPEEILTYEEVALYFPRANRKRPVVLIGPPNIGRHELRQMLMEREADRFSAAVPHTSRPRKDSEVDGQDYHFISRLQFEQDILSRKFVEHGEFEKQYYGTSLEAIRQVVNMGKICILNLHPQSLKILKNSDLKPYVVFMAPPNLDILKRNRQKQRLPVKDEELRDLIERAREMESKYGQYLDLTLVNVDLERTYAQLLNEINLLEREPQWVPASWVDK